MIIVIMAGGKGTRISSVRNDIPKPMILLNKKPVLEHQIEVLKKQGFDKFILVVGYKKENIIDHFGTGGKWNVSITYIKEDEPLGTAGALFYLKDSNEDILLINGDLCFDVNIKKFYQYHKEKKSDITLLTHPNNHPYDSTLIEADESGKIIGWIKKEEKREDYKNRVNAGLHFLSPNVLASFGDTIQKLDMDRDIIQKTLETGQVYAYDSPEYIKDMGTPDRYFHVCEDLQQGKVSMKNLKNKQKAIFLDRDGTLNIAKGYISDPDEIELFEETAEALKLINQSGYLAIVITNQPVIARGECSFAQMDHIHKRFERLLGEQGAYIDALFYCPHHPDKGFDGEVKELKLDCHCRKPNIGLFLKASEKFNIDLSSSYMIGDDLRDYEAGHNAGCRDSIQIKGGLKIEHIKKLIEEDAHETRNTSMHTTL